MALHSAYEPVIFTSCDESTHFDAEQPGSCSGWQPPLCRSSKDGGISPPSARAGGLPSVRRDLKIALTGPGSFVALEQWVVSPSLDPALLQLCGDQSTEWAVGGMHPSATCKQSSV